MLSLEKLCLDLIAKEFQRFYFAFVASQNGHFQRSFKVLQKRYSDQLATLLHENEKLKEEYFEFLLNEHLKLLDCKWLENSRYLNCINDLFRLLPNLETVHFKNCDDLTLEKLATFCRNIIEIDMRHCNITDKGIEHLYKIKEGMLQCPELKNLFIKDSHVTEKGVKNLIQNLPTLEKIDYPYLPQLLYSLHKDNISQNVSKYNLIELNLCEYKNSPCYTDILKTCLLLCPKLESFIGYISDIEQLNLLQNNYLKNLKLNFLIKPKINVDNFLKIKGCSLTALKISDCMVSLSVLGTYCPALTELFLFNVNFTDDDSSSIPVIPCLVKCSFLGNNPSVDKAVRLLVPSSSKLKSVTFVGCKLSSELETQILIMCKKAKEIQFVFTKLESNFLINVLSSCHFLRNVFLIGCMLPMFPFSWKEDLYCFAEKLPNKPSIRIT